MPVALSQEGCLVVKKKASVLQTGIAIPGDALFQHLPENVACWQVAHNKRSATGQVVSHGTPELHRLAERGVPEGPIACGGAGEGGAGSNLVLHPSSLLFVPNGPQ